MSKASVNVVQIMGRLGADPELKGNGDHRFVSFRVATSESRLVGRNWVEDTEWHTVKIWGNTAPAFCQRAKKGTMVHIEGKLTSHIYNEKRYWEIKSRRWQIVTDGQKIDTSDKLLGPEPPKTDPWDKPKSAWTN